MLGRQGGLTEPSLLLSCGISRVHGAAVVSPGLEEEGILQDPGSALQNSRRSCGN